MLISCPNAGISVHNCLHSEDVGLICTFDSSPTPSTVTFPTSPPTSSFCFEGQVEQINSEFSNYNQNGQIYQIVEYDFQFCYNGVYGRLCDIDWDSADADVLCRQFGSYNYGNASVIW